MDGGFKLPSAYYDEEEVIGSSSKYHSLSCHLIKKINRANLKKLRSWKEAVALGLNPCGVCTPYYKQATNEFLSPKPNDSSNPILPVTASRLSDLRRYLVQLLADLEPGRQTEHKEGPGSRIARLQREKIIPREIGPTMLTITEMRNAAEYDSKILSEKESEAVLSAWEVIREWARKNGLDLKA
jgi:hypothetical protein